MTLTICHDVMVLCDVIWCHIAGESRVLFSDNLVKVNHRYKPQDRCLIITGMLLVVQSYTVN